MCGILSTELILAFQLCSPWKLRVLFLLFLSWLALSITSSHVSNSSCRLHLISRCTLVLFPLRVQFIETLFLFWLANVRSIFLTISNTSYKEDHICLIHDLMYHINRFSSLTRVSYRYTPENLSTSSLVWGPITPYSVLYHLGWKGIGGWQKKKKVLTVLVE